VAIRQRKKKSEKDQVEHGGVRLTLITQIKTTSPLSSQRVADLAALLSWGLTAALVLRSMMMRVWDLVCSFLLPSSLSLLD
jgi:hypothetical protein